jgi:hypothetical protein
MDDGMFRPLLAVGVCALLVCLSCTTPLTANRAIWFALRWSLGGGVASSRSEGECEQLTELLRNAQASR